MLNLLRAGGLMALYLCLRVSGKKIPRPSCASFYARLRCPTVALRKDASAVIDLGVVGPLDGFMAGGEVTHTGAAISRPPLSQLITAVITGIKGFETLVKKEKKRKKAKNQPRSQ